MRLFGLIGYPLTHSFSEKHFTEKFAQEGLGDCSYKPFPIERIELLNDILTNHPHLEGLNVTLPHKKEVMAYLDDISNIPLGLPACNCIRIRDGKLTGYNTDWIGFSETLTPLLKKHHTRALILGSGGAAAAITFSLEKMGIGYTIVRRESPHDGEIIYKEISKKIMQDHTIIVNTTPVGMHPRENKCPVIPYQHITSQHLLYDLVYNPAKSLFLQEGEKQGAMIKNGEEMLTIQAEESWRIWNADGDRE